MFLCFLPHLWSLSLLVTNTILPCVKCLFAQKCKLQWLWFKKKINPYSSHCSYLGVLSWCGVFFFLNLSSDSLEEYCLAGCFFENVAMRLFIGLCYVRHRVIWFLGCLIKHSIPPLPLSCPFNQVWQTATYGNWITKMLAVFLPVA